MSGFCLVKSSNQTGIGPVKYPTTATTPSTITAEINAVNTITISSSGACGTSGTVGDYEGDVTLEGTNTTGGQRAIKVLL